MTRIVPLIIVLALAVAELATAQCPCFAPITLSPGVDPTTTAPVQAVAIDGDWSIVTRLAKDTTPAAAIFYRRVAGHWTQHQVLVPSGLTGSFGRSAAISGNVAVVGAGTSTPTGIAYVFRRVGTMWIEEAQLVPSDGALGTSFGREVDTDGARVIVGAPGDLFQDTGALYVYVFDGTSWVPEQKINAPATPEILYFGLSAAIAGDVIAISESQSSPVIPGSGRIYLYARSGSSRTLQTTLYPPVLAGGDKFGETIVFDGSTLAASWWGTFFNHGVVVFEKVGGQWNISQVLPHQTIYMMGLEGSRLVIGNPNSNVVGEDSGEIHVYEKQGGAWEHVRAYADADTNQGEFFHDPLSYSDDTIFWSRGSSGQVFVFSVSNPEIETFEPEVQKVSPASSPSGTALGSRVAMDGDHLLLGVRTDSTNGSNAGAVYAYRRTGATWTHQVKILGGVVGGQYGSAVAIDGNDAMVGARTDLQGRGRVHVLRWDGSAWTTTQVINSPFPQTYEFGSSIAIQGDVALIGADGPDNYVGRVAVLEKAIDGQWSTKQLITPTAPSGESPGEFGTDVAIDGDTFVVGAPYTWTPEFRAGAALVYREVGGTWVQEAFLKSMTPRAFDHFGSAVAIQGDRLLVGVPDVSPLVASGGPKLGEVHAFERTGSTWTEVDILRADHKGALRFGAAIEMEGAEAVIGVGDQFDCGVVYHWRYLNGGWKRVTRFHHSSSVPGDALGASLALDGGQVAALESGGAPIESVNVYSLAKIALYTFYNHPEAGEPLSIETSGGSIGTPGLIVITGINGVPIFAPLLSSSFGADGTWSLDVTVPSLPALPGAAVTLQSFALGSMGDVIASNTRIVAFE